MANNARSVPRLNIRHQRHAHAAKHPRSKQMNEFLRLQAARLSSTSAVVFGKLRKYSARRIGAAANLAAIP
jgi:hypothetical protein